MNVLSVDLSRRTADLRPLEAGLVDQYVGGRGIAARLLFDLVEPGAEPLASASPIIFATGPLTGTPFPMGGRFVAVAKSPLTNTIFSSSCGGRLGVSLRKSGIDAVVLTGATDRLCYLSIDMGDVQFLDASGLWGRDKSYVKSYLHDRHGADASVLLIGTAGETGVLFANIENDGRYLGRGGLGAVLGSKNVKAIVVSSGRGGRKVEVADKDAFSFLAYECKKWLSANPVTSQALPRFGTGVLFNLMRETGLLSVRNYRDPAPFGSSAISGEMVTSGLLQKRKACPFCPVACGRVTKYGDGPEYESLWSLGANLLIYDLDKVAELNGLCNELGMDSISAGAVVAQACELAEKGVMGVSALYGDASAVGRLMVQIAERTGPGAILAQGTKRVAEHFNLPDGDSHVKGLELPAYDPRGAYGNALGYATSNRGGCHLPGYFIGTEVLGIPKLLDRFAVEGKATLLALNQNAFAFMDTLTLCRFAAFAVPTDYYARIAGAVTGRKISWEESLQTGERIWNLERLFNLREGVDRDRLPERFTTFPLDDMLREYYAVRGWDQKGVPTKEKLAQLGLTKDQA